MEADSFSNMRGSLQGTALHFLHWRAPIGHFIRSNHIIIHTILQVCWHAISDFVVPAKCADGGFVYPNVFHIKDSPGQQGKMHNVVINLHCKATIVSYELSYE